MNNSTIIKAIHKCEPWNDSFAFPLQEFKFKDIKKVWGILITLSSHSNFGTLFPKFFKSFIKELSLSYQPDLALHNFERFSKTIKDKNYLYTILDNCSDLLKSIIILFSGSQVLTDSLLSDPEFFDWLMNPNILGKPRSRDEFMRSYCEFSKTHKINNKTPNILRKFKKREYIRIGLRDLIGKTDFQETGTEISFLADTCLQEAYEYADYECRKKYGSPFYEDSNGIQRQAEFTVIGMGKLGGLELNYSSDIDLIYLYTSNKGVTKPTEEFANINSISTHEYFTKLAILLTKTINEITSEGSVFRVDLDLRPDGKSGEIINSLASYEIYYQSWGRTWERQALMKARISAGSEALGKIFLNLMDPFIYKRSLDFSVVQEIVTMKDQINQNLQKKKIRGKNIKLGRGGIREVEFTVQAYQLLFGGKDKGLRTTNTLEILEKLKIGGFIKRDDYKKLREAYIFLRNLENRVQISYGIQTHLFPDEENQLDILALKMKIKGKSSNELRKNLLFLFEKHTDFVAKLFSGLFEEEKKKQAASLIENKVNPVRELNLTTLEEVRFTNPKKALRFFESMRDGMKFSHPTEKSIKNFYAILPKILELCSKAPMPNSAIENLVKFIEASKSRASFLSLFKSNEKLLELLLIIFGSSNFLSGILIKQPDLIDIMIDIESIYRFRNPEKIIIELVQTVKFCKNIEEKKILLRRFKQSEELRIGIRYVIGAADLKGTLADLSSLAEIYLQVSYLTALKELGKRYSKKELPPTNFAVIGMGKLGGSELNFGSDLDIIFVYEETEKSLKFSEELVAYYAKLSQLLYELISQVTSSGYAYKVDTNLRAEGASGVLVKSIEGYSKYFKSRARVWEQQAMTKARFVAGNKDVGEKFINIAQEFTYGTKLEYGSIIEISRSRARMEKELAKETTKSKNVKLGFGGLADIEFTVQVLQMIHGKKNLSLRETNTLTALEQFDALSIFDHNESVKLGQNYLFLRNLECALRILHASFTNHLPEDKEVLIALAKLLGYKNLEPNEQSRRFLNDYLQTTSEVRSFYRKNVDSLLRFSH